MTFRKNPEDLLVRINVQLTVGQIAFIDELSQYGRSAVIRKLITDVMKHQQVQPMKGKVPDEKNEDHVLDYATPMDFEITFDAYANILKDELLCCFADGQDVRCLEPAFSKFLREYVGKQAHEAHIVSFLDTKMRDLGNTSGS